MDTTTNAWAEAIDQADTVAQSNTKDQVDTQDQGDNKSHLWQPPVDLSTLECLTKKAYLREKLIKADSHLSYLKTSVVNKF